MMRAAAFAALVAFACTAFMGFGIALPDPALRLQPSSPPAPPPVFVRASNEYPDLALRFFAADTLFILSYLIVFAGLYRVTAGRALPLASLGMGAGILVALCDATENAFFIVYAMLARQGVPLTDPAVPLIFIVANLKYVAAFGALYAFGFAMPRATLIDWVLSGLMLFFPVAGALGIANPSLEFLRGLFFLAGMPLFAWYFWRRASASVRVPVRQPIM